MTVTEACIIICRRLQNTDIKASKSTFFVYIKPNWQASSSKCSNEFKRKTLK